MEKQPQHNETTTTQGINNETGFLFKKFKDIIPNFSLSYWLTVQDFYDEIIRIKGTNETIDASLVFKIMQKIYKENQEDKENGIDVDFMFSPARKALRALSKNLTGTEDNWNNW